MAAKKIVLVLWVTIIGTFLAVSPTLARTVPQQAPGSGKSENPFTKYSHQYLDDPDGVPDDTDVAFGQRRPSPDENDVTINLVTLAEDLAEATAKNCHAVGIPIDYDDLKNDFISCTKTKVAHIRGKVSQVATSFRLGEGELENHLDGIMESVLKQRPISTKQKRTLSKHILQPICSTLLLSIDECDKPEYATLAQARICKPEFEKDSEEMTKQFFKDLCMDDAAWVLKFLDTKPIRCLEDYATALQSETWKECDRFFESYKEDKSKPGRSKRIESHDEMCKFMGMIGSRFRYVVVSSCSETNPLSGQIIMDTFKKTRDVYTDKCINKKKYSSGSVSRSWSSSGPILAACACFFIWLSHFYS